jgi:hypothetical protein
MESEYKIGIYLKSYAVDKPYNWERRELRSIDRPSAYRVEYVVTLFLTVDENNYRLVYNVQPYEFRLLDVVKSYPKGLYILKVNKNDDVVTKFEHLGRLILGESEELDFDNIKLVKVKTANDYFSFKRSLYQRNIELFILNGGNKTRFSLKEQYWVEYVYETAMFEAFAQHIREMFHNYVKTYIKTYSNIKDIDLSHILEDLQVEVDEIFKNKVGGDDSYYVDETRTISYPIEELDNYLIDYIKIGRRNIYKDSGYTSAYNMAIKGLKTGVLSNEEVKDIRDKLISEYSIESHIFALIDGVLVQYEKCLTIPRLHRNDSGLDSYLMSKSFITSLEKIIGGGAYVVNWDNIGSLMEKANHHIRKLTWWND